MVACTPTGSDSAPSSGASLPVMRAIQAIPGIEVCDWQADSAGDTFVLCTYEQPIDHQRPAEGTFRQRFTISHRSFARPTSYLTTGYHVPTTPLRTEVANLIGGNQIALEHRYFGPSAPQRVDWSTLTIWQAACDQHRLYMALKPVYPMNWIATGGSKGGMTAVYYARFYPNDTVGVVAYGSPNHLPERENIGGDLFFARAGTAEPRAALKAVQREALLRWGDMYALFCAWAQVKEHTFTIAGSAELAFEGLIRDLAWRFWQNKTVNDPIPPASATSAELFAFIDDAAGWDNFTDERLAFFEPYYVAAGTELGYPSYTTPYLDDLLRHPGTYGPRFRTRRDIALVFDPEPMRDIDRWVRSEGSRLMFVYGQNDPWGAERFGLGPGSTDCRVLTVPGGNHAAVISGLDELDRVPAQQTIRRWAADESRQGSRY